MRGVRASELIAIVDFVYYGEAKVDEENLDAFLLLAEEMERFPGLARDGLRKYKAREHPFVQ